MAVAHKLLVEWKVNVFYVSQVVRFLLECNAKLNKKDQYGNTPLIHACLCGNLETATILLQVNRNTQTGCGLWMTSCFWCNRGRVFQSNALVNVVNVQGNTALHEGVRGGHQAVVELLLKAGASPSIRNKRQRTPLECAYELGGKVVPHKHCRDCRGWLMWSLFCVLCWAAGDCSVFSVESQIVLICSRSYQLINECKLTLSCFE